MNFEEGHEIGPVYIFEFARIMSDDDSELETKLAAVDEEVPLLSSVIMRSWWSRDSDTVDAIRECYLCLLLLQSHLYIVAASGWRHSACIMS